MVMDVRHTYSPPVKIDFLLGERMGCEIVVISSVKIIVGATSTILVAVRVGISVIEC